MTQKKAKDKVLKKRYDSAKRVKLDESEEKLQKRLEYEAVDSAKRKYSDAMKGCC